MRRAKLIAVTFFVILFYFSAVCRTSADSVINIRPPVQGSEPTEPMPIPQPTPSPHLHQTVCAYLGYCVCGIFA